MAFDGRSDSSVWHTSNFKCDNLDIKNTWRHKTLQMFVGRLEL
jgi:hypothetical protein